MSAAQLARDDGSRISAGRGSGLDDAQSSSPVPRTPYMQMAFAPLERRLDVAVFRALFASSARQARQFVVHGAVTVNGKKMRYPGYLLNPGDMFQVEPQLVMYATGAPKDRRERREIRLAARKKTGDAEQGTTDGENSEAKGEGEEGKVEEKGQGGEKEEEERNPKDTLKNLLSKAKTIMESDKDVLPAKRKQELRGFQRAVRRVLSRSGSGGLSGGGILADNLEGQFSELISLLKAKKADNNKTKKTPPRKSSAHEEDKKGDEDIAQSTGESAQPGEKLTEAFQIAAQNADVEPDAELTSELSDEEFQVLKLALGQMRDNPIDAEKPYATPWRPRDYMSAFAFIPRYLEVNQNICAAVYLRHPVARPGISEVPSPFGEDIGTAAFAWYLRRR